MTGPRCPYCGSDVYAYDRGFAHGKHVGLDEGVRVAKERVRARTGFVDWTDVDAAVKARKEGV